LYQRQYHIFTSRSIETASNLPTPVTTVHHKTKESKQEREERGYPQPTQENRDPIRSRTKQGEKKKEGRGYICLEPAIPSAKIMLSTQCYAMLCYVILQRERKGSIRERKRERARVFSFITHAKDTLLPLASVFFASAPNSSSCRLRLLPLRYDDVRC
jgi:hypothetical protein